MNLEQGDSASFLKEALAEKARLNSRYSLRAFARNLGLSPGALSLILSRKKKLSVDRAHEIATRLGLSAKEAEFFLLLVERDQSSSLARKTHLQSRIETLQKGTHVFDLGVDQFRLISQWYGLAVLILFTESHPKPSRREGARALGISLAELDSTLERLQRLELLEKVGGTSDRPLYRRIDKTVLVQTRIPSEAIHKYYREIIEKCRESTDSQGPDERISGAQVFAIGPEQVKEIRSLTNEYLDALNRLTSKSKSRSVIYQAYCNVFRLTRKEKS